MQRRDRIEADTPRRARARVLLAGIVLLAASGAGGATLYDNGPVTDSDPDGWCDSGLSPACGGSGEWTFYDNFVLSADATMTGFDYTDWFSSGSSASYVETDWSVFDADPFVSSPIASGTDVAVLTATGPAGQFRFEVSGLSIDLSAGTEYWLGTHNTVTGFDVTTVARVDDPGGGLDASKQSDGAGNDFDYPTLENRAFRIQGTLIPEPSTAVLVAAGLLGLAAAGRHCSAERRVSPAGSRRAVRPS